MDEPGFIGNLADCRVAIWGLGLMGGSLAMALRGKVKRLVGIDTEPQVVAQATSLGIVDAASIQPHDVIDGVDLVILATHVHTIISTLQMLPEIITGPALIMDLGSTKVEIVAAMQALPARFDTVGAHPMCGKEKGGLQHADPAIYQDAPFALVALERTTAHTRALAEEVVQAAGACPLWIEAEEHDRWVAATSHLPYLLSSALALTTSREAASLVGPGFRSTARLAASDPRMMMEIIASNAGNIQAGLHDVIQQLSQFDEMLEQKAFQSLTDQLQAGAKKLHELVK